MKKQLRALLGALFSVVLLASAILPVLAAKITTTPSGYTSSADVEYQYHTSNEYISNWGARGEVCEFLSPNAQSYYVGNYTYDVLSSNQGGTGKSNAPSSALYKALQNMMKAEHTHQTSYKETRDLYKYTDCVTNGISNISSFYSGIVLTGNWDGAATWNREHTWPNSKGLGGNDENDIMMLRPTSVQENSSRGNTAYGEGGSYYDPGESVRGDCARIVLYVYVRWGNTSYMWGTSGVMESVDILLKWMEEDPVDTWEMGRNDAVESITGVRNVFVDYPEYAWLLFGEEIPQDMPTPSGSANEDSQGGTPGCSHANTRTENKKDATCTSTGYSGDEYCNDCGKKVKTGSTVAAKGHEGELQWVEEATCVKDGYSGDLVCKECGTLMEMGHSVQATGNHTFGEWEVVEEATDTTEGTKEHKCIHCDFTETASIPAGTTGTGETEDENSGNQDGGNQGSGNQDSENQDDNQDSGNQDGNNQDGNNQDGIGEEDTNQGGSSTEDGNTNGDAGKDEDANQDSSVTSDDPSAKTDMKKIIILGATIIVPSGCAVGIGAGIFIKKRAIK